MISQSGKQHCNTNSWRWEIVRGTATAAAEERHAVCSRENRKVPRGCREWRRHLSVSLRLALECLYPNTSHSRTHACQCDITPVMHKHAHHFIGHIPAEPASACCLHDSLFTLGRHWETMQCWGKRRPTAKYRDTLPWAAQIWLNRWRCRLGCGLKCAQGSMCYMECKLV